MNADPLSRADAAIRRPATAALTRRPDPADAVVHARPGTSLRPIPPGASKDKNTRYLDIHEDDELDEAQMATWVKQAAVLPGWVP